MLDIFEHSTYFADDLLRYPELLDEIGEPFQLEGGAMADAAALRRYYRRQMLRIQSESVLHPPPIFDTLRQDLGAGGYGHRRGLPDRGGVALRHPRTPATCPATR